MCFMNIDVNKIGFHGSEQMSHPLRQKRPIGKEESIPTDM